MKLHRLIAILLLITLLVGSAALSEAPSASMSAEELCQAGKDAEAEGDYEKAMEYYQLAAAQDDGQALWSIGSLYYNGNGVEQSYEKAMEYYQKAAEQGNV